MTGAVDRAIRDRLSYLRRELEIAEREAKRKPFDVRLLPPDQRTPFETMNQDIRAAQAAIPLIRAEITELETTK